LTERRLILLITTAAAPITLLAVAPHRGPWTALGIVALWLIAFHWSRAWRCPRCGEQFAAGAALPLNSYCRHCGVPQYAPLSLHGPFEQHEAGANTSLTARERNQLSVRWQRIVGGSQAVAGALILVFIGRIAPNTVLGAWQEWSRVGFAALAMLGGAALFSGNRSGYTITRLVLAAQVVSFVVPGAAYEMSAGLYAGLRVGSDSLGASGGWRSGFTLWVGQTTGWMVSLNLFALALLSLIPPAHSAEPAPTRALTTVGADGRLG